MSAADPPRPAAPARDLLLAAAWFGLVGGFGESVYAYLLRYNLGRFTHLNRNIVWTAPISATVLVVVVALLLLPLARRSARWWQVSLTVLAGVAALGVLLYAARLHPLARVVLAAGIGTQAAALVTRYRAGFRRLARLTVPVLAACSLLGGAALHFREWLKERRTLAALPAARAGAPNVLLLILDTVRAMDLGLYGYARATTPELSRFAARGAVFEHAIAPAPWTLPSHAAIFTGHPAAELSAGWRTPMDGRFRTLAEALRDRGWATAGFVGNLEYTTVESGLHRGFAHYESGMVTPQTVLLLGAVSRSIAESGAVRRLLGWHEVIGRKHARDILGRLENWIGAHPGRPWFVFANLYDAHNPYLPPAPFDTAFTGRPIAAAERNFGLDNTDSVSVEQARPERDAYDQAILALDHDVGALLRDLEARGRLRNTIVVITADHGEQFGEHGLLNHGNSLYLPSLHVPLIVAYDGVAPPGARVPATVSLVDLAATILDLAGEPAALPGTSLRATWSGNDSAAVPPVVASVRFASGQPPWYPIARGDMATAVTGTRQLIRDGSGAEVVFDLTRDPFGGTPADAEPETAARLRAALPTP